MTFLFVGNDIEKYCIFVNMCVGGGGVVCRCDPGTSQNCVTANDVG